MRARGRCGCGWRGPTGGSCSRSATTARASTPVRPAGSAWPGWPTGSPRWTECCTWRARPGAGRRCVRRSRCRRPPMPDPLRVVIADDNYLVREGSRRLLEDSGEVTVLAAVGSADELVDAVRRTRPDAVLTDIRMPAPNAAPAAGPAMEGIDAAHRIRAAEPHVG